MENSCVTKVSKASKGSEDPFRRKVEPEDSDAGTIRGADDSPCLDHHLRIGHQNHAHINEHVDEHIDHYGDQPINNYQNSDPDDHGHFDA